MAITLHILFVDNNNRAKIVCIFNNNFDRARKYAPIDFVRNCIYVPTRWVL